jgi:hypothetical protein
MHQVQLPQTPTRCMVVLHTYDPSITNRTTVEKHIFPKVAMQVSTTTSDIMTSKGSTTPTVGFFYPSGRILPASTTPCPAAQPDTDSDGDMYNQRNAPSAESLGATRGMGVDSSIPAFDGPAGAREPYPAWSVDRRIPLSKEEIEDIFLDLTQKFGFQRDSMRNMVRSSWTLSYQHEVDYPSFSSIS